MRISQVPRLVFESIRRGRPSLIALALEVSVPPLSLLCFLSGALFAVAAASALVTSSVGPMIAAGSVAGTILVSVVVAWLRFAYDRVPVATLLAAPFYALRKLPLYCAFLVRRQESWVRTERDDESEPS